MRTNSCTYQRTFAYSAGHCPGVELYMWAKGAPPWSEARSYAAEGYCRAGRPCTSGPAYPIEVMRRSGGGAGGVDNFWFARWQDPMDGNQWRGLGPVKFWCTGDNGSGWCAPASEHHYLVDCTVTPTCYARP